MSKRRKRFHREDEPLPVVSPEEIGYLEEIVTHCRRRANALQRDVFDALQEQAQAELLLKQAEAALAVAKGQMS